ncbi:MAG TPA: hypothetical protein VJ875_16335 [Pyrinomonadaceae bacterium]|nr:hypothetical protein [Pyrinomonadaceae bacterium]
MINHLSQIREFENELDQSLRRLTSLAFDGQEALHLALNFLDFTHSQLNEAAAGMFSRGLDILAPFFIDGEKGEPPDAKQLVLDLNFAGHYFLLRDYLYYTYNAKNSFTWQFSENTLEIHFKDSTIPRQFYLQANNHFLISINAFAERDHGKRLKQLLKGKDEFAHSEVPEEVERILEEEADLKLSLYYNPLDPSDEIEMGGYKYRDYYLVFKALMMKALYHRYHSQANEKSGVIRVTNANLINDLHKATGVPPAQCARILDDITYDARARHEGIQPVYFSLFRFNKTDEVILSPFDLAVWEGSINVLRVIALRKPELFLKNLSTPLGASFVTRVQGTFVSAGFKCFKDLRLNQFDSRLPDIDLLVISEEPTFGYVLFCCEVKNPIPPQWAKDHLRVLDQDSVAKAFGQLDLVREFLLSEDGIRWIRTQLPAEGLPHFGDQFLISVFSLVITSRNAGMFFGEREHTVIDYITLGRILERCDGDVVYLLRALREVGIWADSCLKVSPVHCNVGRTSVAYDVVQIDQLLDFAQAEFKSSGADTRIAEEFIKEGYHPFDTFEGLRSEKDPSDDN